MRKKRPQVSQGFLAGYPVGANLENGPTQVERFSSRASHSTKKVVHQPNLAAQNGPWPRRREASTAPANGSRRNPGAAGIGEKDRLGLSAGLGGVYWR